MTLALTLIFAALISVAVSFEWYGAHIRRECHKAMMSRLPRYAKVKL